MDVKTKFLTYYAGNFVFPYMVNNSYYADQEIDKISSIP